jgi:hypothetical protein
MIFVDRSIPRSIAQSLQKVRSDVLWLEEVFIFRHDTPDEFWAQHVGIANWLVVTRDKKLRYRPAERAKLIRAGVGAFVFTQKDDLTKWDYLKLLARNLDDMERIFASTPRPFIYAVQHGGTLKQVF